MGKGIRRKVRLWVISGVAFVIVVGIAGCSAQSSSPRAASSTGMHAPQDSATDGAAFIDPGMTAAAAPAVNIFGELDGIAPPPARKTAQAGFEQHTYVDEGFDGDVSVSPDGSWLAFSSTRHSERADIYLQRVGGMSVTQLTSDAADDAFPCFSPDGRRVAFCSTRAGSWDIYTMDVDGRNAIQITSGPAQDLHPSFSPDGNRLAYCSMGSRSGQWELWTVDLRTSQRKMIGYGLFPSWSPDKTQDRIAFQKSRARGSRWFSLWTLDLIDGEARRVTEVAVSSNAAIVSPVWSPDGTRLAFSTIVDPARAGGTPSAVQQDIWTVNADGSARQRITDGNGTNATPFWASNGRIYFVSDRGGTECVWSAQAGGTGFAGDTRTPPQQLGSADANDANR